MKNFKVRFNRRKQEKRFKAFIEKVKKQPEWKDEAADLAIKNIQIETRKQKYIKDGSRQPALSQDWIERKQELAKSNPKGTSYGASKSNLTLTGQLLESLKRTDNKKRVEIEPTGKRKPYTYPSGKRAKAKHTPTNKELTEYLKKQGRRFIGFNDKLKKAVTKVFKDHVRRNLKNFNKK